ncbi:ATP-binding cassette domain-containing protein [Lacimicrobium sp. SS2-24]|uniref:ABC transporter ATP-binding protein n=1 Tax=Lacimicrobium sp. SS2-24 TaxID=2005569 RepID=UPI000B4BC17B|nr:ATP-binding cassette domain-containing protein [Lacimicrobium sp. SS2-24]
MKTSKNILLEVKNVSLTYSSLGFFSRFKHHALTDVSFSVYKGETFGIMGRNGCGKSTLLQILADVIAPTTGYIETSQKITRALLSVGLGFNLHLSGRDNALISAMLQGATKKQAKQVLESIKEFSELGDFFEQPVKTYSSGMRSRLGFATALKTEVDLLLLDETLSVGDASFNKKAEQAMIDKFDSEQTVIFVSHNGEQVKRLCDRAIWIEKGKVIREGDVEDVADVYQVFMKKLKDKKAEERRFG